MRTRMAIVVLLACLAGCAGTGTARVRDYEPVSCAQAMPYEGPPLYHGPIDLPPAGFVGGAAFADGTAGALQRALGEAMRHTGARAMTAAVASTAGSWHATRPADGTPRPLRLWWASVGKAFTATVILQLVEEGRLSLDDPVSRWVPAVPNAPAVTIDHLLHHTAGLFSANEDLMARRDPRYRTPDEHIAIAARHGALCCPGQRWRYSNTGYTVLGRIIEAVDGRPYHEAVNQRIALRLRLSTLRALAPGEAPGDMAPLAPADGSRPGMAPDWGYAAGCVVASAEDMVAYWQALLTGRLLNAASTASLFARLHPMFDAGTFYGRGAMLYEFIGRAGMRTTWLGHSGGSPGIKAVVAWAPEQQAFVAVALTGDGSAEAAANLLLRQLPPPP